MAPPPGEATVARIFAALLNSFFLIASVILLLLSIFATISPPKAQISPKAVGSYPQYFVTIILLGGYSSSLFLVSALGLFSLCCFNSFLISLHILGQVAIVFAQLIAVAFTLTVRARVHSKVEEVWRESPQCVIGSNCEPINKFLRSESIIIALFCIFLILQLCLLAASSFLAERKSSQERYALKMQLALADENDD